MNSQDGMKKSLAISWNLKKRKKPAKLDPVDGGTQEGMSLKNSHSMEELTNLEFEKDESPMKSNAEIDSEHDDSKGLLSKIMNKVRRRNMGL